MALSSTTISNPADIPILDPIDIPPRSSSLYRSLFKMMFSVDCLFLKYGINHVPVATLTFPTPVFSAREASERLNVFLTRFRRRWEHYLWVRERSANRKIHYHLLFPVPIDVYEGVDLELIARLPKQARERKRAAINPPTLALWDEFELCASEVGFGRCEVMPVYKNGQAMARYLGKNVEQFRDLAIWHEEKRSRWWTQSRALKSYSNKFTWNSRRHRERIQNFARAHGAPGLAGLLSLCGNAYSHLAWRWELHGCPVITESNRQLYIRPPSDARCRKQLEKLRLERREQFFPRTNVLGGGAPPGSSPQTRPR